MVTPARAGTGAATIAATGAAGAGVVPRTFTLCFAFPGDADIGFDHDRAALIAHVRGGITAEPVPRASRPLFALRWATGAIHALLTFRAWRFFYTHAIYAHLIFAAAIGDTGAALLVLSCGAWVFWPALTINPHLIGFALRNALRPHLVQIRRADALTTSERGASGTTGCRKPRHNIDVCPRRAVAMGLTGQPRPQAGTAKCRASLHSARKVVRRDRSPISIASGWRECCKGRSARQQQERKD